MYNVEEFCRKADIDSDFLNDGNGYRIANEYVIMENWLYMDHLTNAEVDAIGDGTGKDNAQVRAAAKKHVELVNALRKDGYKPTDEEDAFLSLAIKTASGGGR